MARLIGQEQNGHMTDRYWLHTGDDGKDRITVETTEDIEPLLEANKRERNDFRPRSDTNEIGRKIASVNGCTIMELARLNKMSFRELFAMKSERAIKVWNRFLNDLSMRDFRTSTGRVDVGRGR